MGTMSQGFGLNIIEEESPCKKIDYLSSIISLDSYARTGILRLRAVTGPAEAQVSEKKADIYSPAAQVPNNGADIKKRQRHEYISGGLPDIEL